MLSPIWVDDTLAPGLGVQASPVEMSSLLLFCGMVADMDMNTSNDPQAKMSKGLKSGLLACQLSPPMETISLSQSSWHQTDHSLLHHPDGSVHLSLATSCCHNMSSTVPQVHRYDEVVYFSPVMVLFCCRKKYEAYSSFRYLCLGHHNSSQHLHFPACL